MADPRLFRITRDNGTVTYGDRVKVAAIAAAARAGWTNWYKIPVKIEAIANADVLPWQDVTREFIPDDE